MSAIDFHAPCPQARRARPGLRRLAALLVERHPLAIACPKVLRSRAVELAVLAPIVFCIGFAIGAGI